jgi:hypothetical protein
MGKPRLNNIPEHSYTVWAVQSFSDDNPDQPVPAAVTSQRITKISQRLLCGHTVKIDCIDHVPAGLLSLTLARDGDVIGFFLRYVLRADGLDCFEKQLIGWGRRRDRNMAQARAAA